MTDWDIERDTEDHDSDGADTFPGVRAIRETPKALLCVFPEFGGAKDVELWVPKSMISDDSEVYGLSAASSEGNLVVKAWWTEKALAEYKATRRHVGGGSMSARLKRARGGA